MSPWARAAPGAILLESANGHHMLTVEWQGKEQVSRGRDRRCRPSVLRGPQGLQGMDTARGCVGGGGEDPWQGLSLFWAGCPGFSGPRGPW